MSIEVVIIDKLELDHRVHHEVTQSLPFGTKVFSALFCGGLLYLWWSCLTFRPDDLKGYSTVTGTLVSAEEHLSSGRSPSGHLDIYLKDNRIRYCVPADGYLDYFKREAFFAEVPKGAAIQLHALASEIATPSINATPTVFVRGVRVGSVDYCTVQDHIVWQISNNRSEWLLAIAITVLTAFIVFKARRSPKMPWKKAFAGGQTVE